MTEKDQSPEDKRIREILDATKASIKESEEKIKKLSERGTAEFELKMPGSPNINSSQTRKLIETEKNLMESNRKIGIEKIEETSKNFSPEKKDLTIQNSKKELGIEDDNKNYGSKFMQNKGLTAMYSGNSTQEKQSVSKFMGKGMDADDRK